MTKRNGERQKRPYEIREEIIKAYKENAKSSHDVEVLCEALLSETAKPKLWGNAPEWASTAMVVWYGKAGQVATSQEYTRTLPKSRIDEIAEEAVDKYLRGAVGAGSLTDIIKSAIMKGREEYEVTT